MKAFHNDKEVQEKYLSRVRAHAIADELIRGSYWEQGEDGVFRGCAVGCTIHGDNHAAYETELGIPIWIAKFEDRIFEGVSEDRARVWPVEFLEAVNIGSDLSKILIPMLIFIVESAREKTKNKKALKAIDGVLNELKKDILDIPKLREARAASSAAYAADAASSSGAAAAAYAAYAAYAVDASSAAIGAAAAYAVDASSAAAAGAARRNEYEKFADKLLELIRGCR